MLRIELYSRPGCHLCEEAKATLLAAASRYDFELVERNVEDNPQWEADYGREVPVIFIEGRKAFKYRIPPGGLEKRISGSSRSRH